eukprot:12054939-Heterocapsa_arctica.AAC.1
MEFGATLQTSRDQQEVVLSTSEGETRIDQDVAGYVVCREQCAEGESVEKAHALRVRVATIVFGMELEYGKEDLLCLQQCGQVRWLCPWSPEP